MRDVSRILAAQELLQKGITSAREGDSRFGAKHNRRSRGFVKVPYADKIIVFYPMKNWPATTGISVVTMRHWIKNRVITAYNMHDMYVMCLAELVSIRNVSDAWYRTHSVHLDLDPKYISLLQNGLSEVRYALDSYKRGMTMSHSQLALLKPSFEDRHAS